MPRREPETCLRACEADSSRSAHVPAATATAARQHAPRFVQANRINRSKRKGITRAATRLTGSIAPGGQVALAVPAMAPPNPHKLRHLPRGTIANAKLCDSFFIDITKTWMSVATGRIRRRNVPAKLWAAPSSQTPNLPTLPVHPLPQQGALPCMQSMEKYSFVVERTFSIHPRNCRPYNKSHKGQWNQFKPQLPGNPT